MPKRKNPEFSSESESTEDNEKKQKTYHGQDNLLSKLLYHPDLDQLFYSSLNTSESTVTKLNVRRKCMRNFTFHHRFAPNVLFIHGIGLIRSNKTSENIVYNGLKSMTFTIKQFHTFLQSKNQFSSLRNIRVADSRFWATFKINDFELTKEQFPVLRNLFFDVHVCIIESFHITCPEFKTLESTQSFRTHVEMNLPSSIERIWIPKLTLYTSQIQNLIKKYPNLKGLGFFLLEQYNKPSILDFTRSQLTSLKITTAKEEKEEYGFETAQVKLSSLEKFEFLELSGLSCSVINHKTTTNSSSSAVVSDMRWMNLNYISNFDFLRSTVFPHINFFRVFPFTKCTEEKDSLDLITNIFNNVVQRNESQIEIFESLENQFTITDTLLYCYRCRNIKHLEIEQNKKQLVVFIEDVSDLKELAIEIENGNDIHIKPRAHQLDDLRLVNVHSGDKSVLNVFAEILKNVLSLNALSIRIGTLDDWNEDIMPLLKGKHPEYVGITFNSAASSKKNIFKLMNMDKLERVYIRSLDYIAKLHVHLKNLESLKQVAMQDYGQVTASIERTPKI